MDRMTGRLDSCTTLHFVSHHDLLRGMCLVALVPWCLLTRAGCTSCHGTLAKSY